jgi:hypothetical protein
MICSYLCKRARGQHTCSLAYRLCANTTYLVLLRLVVARVHGVLAVAWLAQQLPAVDGEWCQAQTSVRILHKRAVLPLHDATGT